MMRKALAVGMMLLSTAPIAAAQDSAIVIRAATILDGRGSRLTGGAVVVRGGRITDVVTGDRARGAAVAGRLVLDLGDATILPGLIDGHVHFVQYLNAKNRTHTRDDGDTPTQTALAIVENLRRTLWSGVTTVQSMGSPEDADYRAAVAAGRVDGPRILTTLGAISNERLSPDSLRALVRARRAEGADAIKIFASRSIREGGVTTMSAEQLGALCGEARALGLRTLVHAHSAESMQLAIRAGCTQIEHGIFATPPVLAEMAERGTILSAQCGLIFRNYLERRASFEGIGNFNAEGFAALERALPLASDVIRRASRVRGLKTVWGTDAVAGAHGSNVEDLVCRVREAGQDPMAALISATSGGADALGLADEIGSIAPGYRADIIATAGDPSNDITAVRRVVFVMKDGKVVRVEAGTTTRR